MQCSLINNRAREERLTSGGMGDRQTIKPA